MSATRNKPVELIVWLAEADTTGMWMRNDLEAVATGLMGTAATPTVTDYQREIELCRREKELADHELAITRELQLLRGTQRLNVSDREQ